MQTVTTAFSNRAAGTMRPLSFSLLMSFPKSYLSGVAFFTIGVSLIGGPDIIKGTGAAVQEWDKYQYDDYSNRIIDFEVIRQEDPYSSVALAMADITLDNHDDYFTPGAGSIIDGFILPYRPIKLFAGFGGENVPVFIGLTEKMPTIDSKAKTITFHCIDFMYSLMNTPLDESVMYQSKRTDEVVSSLLQLAGLTTTQFSLDPGFNIITFAYFEKGTKLGDAFRELMEAEQGRLYMDETGIIKFKNRQSYGTTPVLGLNSHNIIAVNTTKQDDLVNVVEIKAKVREVQAKQKIWELQSPVVVPANGSLVVWADFDDPITTIDAPVYITGATTSSYATNTSSDGTGSANNAAISVVASTFAKSYKMTFSNSSATPTYITALELFATPAKVVKEIYVREADATSIAKYDERVLTIENEFINNETEATSKALILVQDYKDYGRINNVEIKGNPALQLRDPLSINFKDLQTYVITKIVNRYQSGKFTQNLEVLKKTFESYFTIGVSTIGGTDKIAP